MTKLTPFLLLIFSLFCLTTSCAKKKDAAESAANAADTKIPEPEADKIIIDEGFTVPATNGAFNVESIDINGALLEITVSHGGGCEEHIYSLYTDLKYLKSYPVQLNLFLEHIDNNDKCRALITKKLLFDISGIEYSGTNELILRFNNTKETISYKY